MRRTTKSKPGQAVAIVFFFLGFFVNVARAQKQTITGSVSDSANNALPLATVNLLNDKATVLQYTFTDENGDFSLTLTSEEASLPLWLEVSYVGYKSLRIAVVSDQFTYHFKLVQDTSILKEVVVHTKPPVEQMGDTMRYDVKRFAQEEDRSIGDVLKRMPGIEVADNGAIYFNGKKISNLYIQGDDLMNGRYGSATRAIRKDMIASVDIIRNYQPVKVLKNKIHSDNTALNLVLKDPGSLKLSVNGMIGAGWPRLYDASATAILLNNRIKALNNVALNNSGTNYTGDFKQLGVSDFTSDIDNSPPEFSLSQATIGPPDLPLPDYYFNHSGIINLNDLYKTRKDIQFKLNLQAYRDRNSLNYFSRTNSYLQNDTISYKERQSITNRPSLWNTSLNVMMNKDRYFFNNNLSFELANEDNTTHMDFNDDTFNQGISKKIKKFTNDINWIPSLPGKGIGELRWLISYNDSRQSLDIGKGYYFPVPDQEDHYNDVIQRLKIPTLFSNLYLGYKIPGNTVAQEYMAGFILESEELDSHLDLVKNGGKVPYAGDAGNHLHWRRGNVYFSSEYQIKYNRLKSTIRLPVSYQRIHYFQQLYSLDSKNVNLLFNPLVKISYDFDPEHFLDIRYAFNNDFSDISGLFKGGILQNYRTFVSNEANLQKKATHSFAATYNFQKAINMLFIHTGISYDKTIADAILSTELMDNIQKTVFLPYRNRRSRFSLKAGFSKYLFRLKTTTSLKSRWSRYRYIEIVNRETQPFYSNSLLFSAKIMKKIPPMVALVYEPRGIWNSSHSSEADSGTGSLTHHAFRLDQRLSVGIAPVKGLNAELVARHSFSKESNSNPVQYLFMDAKIIYSDKQKRVDLSFSVTNLFNVTTYTLYSLTPYQLVIDQYHIRGRMGIFRLNYYF